MSKRLKKDCTTVQGAANRIGVKKATIERWIEEDKIEVQDGKILISDVEFIKSEIDEYISIETFLKWVENEKFDSKYVSNRNKFIDYLEENNFWGLKIFYPDDLKFSYENNASFYLKKKDIATVEENTQIFFRYFGLNEEEKCQCILDECNYKKTVEMLNLFLGTVESYTPVITEFVYKTSQIELTKLTDKQVIKNVESMAYKGSGDLFISFIDFTKKHLGLKLGNYTRKERTTNKDNGAYPYKKYVIIAKNVFNEDILNKNNVIKKSLESSFYFEQWLFICSHFVCGWRAADICNEWPNVDNRLLEGLGINIDLIKQSILNGNISDTVYYEIGKYIEKKVELSATKPHKTGKANDLLAPIGKEMKIFFGRMALIAAYHSNNSGEGNLKENRIGDYLNFVKIRELFGDEIYLTFGRHNLQSRRLNKSYLQSMEERARQNGAGTMAAYTIASYARNHSDIDTTAIYLYDHGLNGETAEVVLAMMLDRGVFGTIRYSELLAAFPNAFEKLTAKEQTKFLAECNVSAYELEIMSSDLIEAEKLKDSFAEGNKQRALEILSEMFEVSQGYGKAKDRGVHCKKRALGIACENPTFDSCIANVCPYLIFTEEGVKSLIQVIYAYKKKIEETRNPKYIQILDKVIMPAYKDIMTGIKNRMNPNEYEALRLAVGEYNGKYIKDN
ncbi:MAG: hypothetical protein K6D38_00120 [Pseudobutyrivibrio sp.]|nr:hypothetical protein [Pseudobutyrivibrio sp.]